MIDLEYLHKQLAEFEQEKRNVMETFLRIEGALAMTRHLIADLEQDARDKTSDPPAFLAEHALEE